MLILLVGCATFFLIYQSTKKSWNQPQYTIGVKSFYPIFLSYSNAQPWIQSGITLHNVSHQNCSQYQYCHFILRKSEWCDALKGAKSGISSLHYEHVCPFRTSVTVSQYKYSEVGASQASSRPTFEQDQRLFLFCLVLILRGKFV